jgi:NAD(P)-dependent dehydrogenase (short-subunit alcohol dehydrogenase family)
MAMNAIDSRVALVTGASSGIGLDLTRTLLERGYRVVGLSRSATRRGTLEPSERLAVLDGDVGDPAVAQRAVDEAVARFGRLDLLVNNAGIFLAKPFTDYTAEEYAAFVRTNFAGFVHPTQAALRFMAPRGAGHVVNLGTSLVATPVAGVPAALPVLIKGGIEAATRSLAIEYAPRGIRVNTVAAGIIDTPMHAASSHAALARMSPAGRLGRVDEVSAAVLWLESAPFVSGEVVHVDGGAHAGRW